MTTRSGNGFNNTLLGHVMPKHIIEAYSIYVT